MKSLDVVAWAWPAEVAVVTAYTLAAPAFVPLPYYQVFVGALPLLTALIAAQGGAAFWGKAAQDKRAATPGPVT